MFYFMATKKKQDERNKKGQFQPKNKEGHRFVENNKEAEKWTEQTVMPILQEIFKTLTYGKDDANGNLVRANDIKLAGEVRLMHGVTKQRWNEWKNKFKNNSVVSDLIETISEILECRLIYSGTQMDTFILKNHYDYKEKTEIDHGATASFLDFLKETSNGS